MKKFLTVFMVILGVSIMLASQKMQVELITYWKTNGIEYFEDDEAIILPLTENLDTTIFIVKEHDYIYFVFNMDTVIDDFIEVVKNTEKLPYSKEFREDLFDCLMENLTYYTTFNRTLDPYYEWIEDYLVYVDFFVRDDYVFLGID